MASKPTEEVRNGKHLWIFPDGTIVEKVVFARFSHQDYAKTGYVMAFRQGGKDRVGALRIPQGCKSHQPDKVVMQFYRDMLGYD